MLRTDFRHNELSAANHMVKSIHIDSSGLRNFTQVREAALLANELLRNKDFYDRIAAHAAFDLATVTPKYIAFLMRKTNIIMDIELYHALTPLKNYDGYDDVQNPYMIHLNIWKLDRSPASICNTIIHSCIHAVNAHHKQFYFGHGDQALSGKDNTAPYWIGALAQQMVSKEEAMIIPMEHDPYEPHVKESRKLYTIQS